VVKKGDTVTVKLIDRDERGRLRLSMKALEPRPEGMPEPDPSASRVAAARAVKEGARGGRRGGGGRGGSAARRRRLAAGCSMRPRPVSPRHRGVHRTDCANGLTVLSEFMPGVRSVAFGAWVRFGTLHEPRERWAWRTCSSTWCSRARRAQRAEIALLARVARRVARCLHGARAHQPIRRACSTSTSHAADVIGDLMFHARAARCRPRARAQGVLEEIAMVEDTPTTSCSSCTTRRCGASTRTATRSSARRRRCGRSRCDDLRELHARAVPAGAGSWWRRRAT
jgi:hypothetical protein